MKSACDVRLEILVKEKEVLCDEVEAYKDQISKYKDAVQLLKIEKENDPEKESLR